LSRDYFLGGESSYIRLVGFNLKISVVGMFVVGGLQKYFMHNT
jgi:hypothetical protein